jgi:hypothetical protein
LKPDKLAHVMPPPRRCVAISKETDANPAGGLGTK